MKTYFALWCPVKSQWIGQGKNPVSSTGTPFLWGQRHHAQNCLGPNGKAGFYNSYYKNQFRIVRVQVKVDPRDLHLLTSGSSIE